MLRLILDPPSPCPILGASLPTFIRRSNIPEPPFNYPRYRRVSWRAAFYRRRFADRGVGRLAYGTMGMCVTSWAGRIGWGAMPWLVSIKSARPRGTRGEVLPIPGKVFLCFQSCRQCQGGTQVSRRAPSSIRHMEAGAVVLQFWTRDRRSAIYAGICATDN